MNIQDNTTVKFSQLSKGQVFKLSNEYWIKLEDTVLKDNSRMNCICLQNGLRGLVFDNDDVTYVVATFVLDNEQA